MSATTRQSSEATTANNHGRPTKKAKRDDDYKEETPTLQPLLLNRKDIWIENILPFLGIGNYIFVAGICKDMKVIYQDYYSSEEKKGKLPEVYACYYIRGRTRKMLVTETSHREAFASLSRAKYWDENTKHLSSDYRLGNHGICKTIAKYGNIPTLEWAHKQPRFPWDWRTCVMAARAGDIEILKYAHDNGCPWDARTCKAAAWKGRLDILQYARDNGCPWDFFTCSEEAGAGRLDILKYAHENGCPWNSNTCTAAAAASRLDILKYAHENGCDWDSSTLIMAIRNGHQEIVEYARANGCPEPPPNMMI